MVRPGTRIADRYVVVEALGAGGMGVVVRARDDRLGRDVAVKVLPSSAVGDRVARARLVREARAAAALEHASVVRVYDVGETEDGGAYLVMELVRGTTLRARLRRSVSFDEGVALVVDAARAVAVAHAAGLVHRDIKPDNVMIRDDGSLVVLDFGLAKPITSAIGATELTAEGQLVGTPAYLAPEQARGEAVDERADQFALGVMAYEVLTGQLPWHGATALAVIAEVLRDTPAAPSSRRADLPAALDDVILRALAKDPAERHPSVGAFADALARAAGGEKAAGSARQAADLAPTERAPSMPPVRSDALAITEAAPAPSTKPDQALATTLAAPSASEPTPPTKPSKRPGARGPKLLVGLAIAAVGIAAVAAAAVATIPRHGEPSAASSASPSAAIAPARPMAITDHPPPASTNADALAAYAQGLEAERDGRYIRASERFERATRLDPGLGAAHLRLALIWMVYGDASARAHYRAAAEARRTLSARDVAILEATAPLFDRDPPDVDRWVTRMDALAAAFPNDAEIQMQRGEVANAVGDFRGSIAALERALAADPSFGFAWSRKVEMERYASDDAAAQRTSNACAQHMGGSARCPAPIDELTTPGCAAFEALTRGEVAAAPSSQSYENLASVLVVKHASREAIDEALAHASAAIADSAARRRREARSKAAFAVTYGDFTAAIAAATELARVIEADNDIGEHSTAARLLVRALEESGDGRAAQVALAFVRRRDAWSSSPWPDDGSLAHDATGELLGTAYRGGLVTAPDYDRQLGAWRDGWAARLRGGYRSYLWFSGYAAEAWTPEEAKGALAADALAATPPTYFPNEGVDGDFLLGRTLALAGRAREAIPRLEKAASRCNALRGPFELVQSHLFLGRAREDEHDVANACAEYDEVLRRWGDAKPRSVTAEQARARRTALRCP